MTVKLKEIKELVYCGIAQNIEDFASFDELNNSLSKNCTLDPEKAKAWNSRVLIAASFGTYGCNGKLWLVGGKLYALTSRNNYIFL